MPDISLERRVFKKVASVVGSGDVARALEAM